MIATQDLKIKYDWPQVVRWTILIIRVKGRLLIYLGREEGRMSESEFVRVYDSQNKAYREAFKVFLKHTDQKINTRKWLKGFVETLTHRQVFIDAGAGTGELTSWIAPEFERTAAIEPNPYLREEFRKHLPDCQLFSGFIMDTQPPELADLILCSHVFYYIDGSDWMITLERLTSWLKPKGVVLVILQNPQTDFIQMIDHFLGKRFDLSPLAAQFQEKKGRDYFVKVDTVQAHFTPPDLSSAYMVAEFMLNLFPITKLPSRREIEEYVSKKYKAPQGGYRLSCHQDILSIQSQS